LKTPEITPKEYYKIIETETMDIDIDPEFNITFRITDNCNLSCEYCHWHNGISYKTEDIKATVDKLFDFLALKGIKSALFYFHGGEPTVHKDIIEIIEYIRSTSENNDIETFIEVQTNLTSKIEALENLIHNIDLLDISYHHIELIKHNKLDVFLDNYKYLKEHQVHINNMDIMLENVDDLDNFYEICRDLLSYDLIKNSEMIYGFCHYEKNQETYDKHIAFYKEHNKTEQRYEIDGITYNTNELFQKGMDCRGWHCEAGTSSLTVNGDGNVFNCGIHMTNFTNRCIDEKPFTNLVTDKVAVKKLSVLYKTGTKCRWNYCGGDFYLNRTKIEDN